MKRRKKKKKKLNFVGDDKSDFNIYKKGAIIGSLVGGVSGLVLGKKIILMTVIGAVVGGYIAYKINNDSSDTTLKKFTQSKNEEDAD